MFGAALGFLLGELYGHAVNAIVLVVVVLFLFLFLSDVFMYLSHDSNHQLSH